MKSVLLKAFAAALMLGSVSSMSQAEVKEMWSLTGFSHPESVDFDLAHGVFYVSNIGGAPLDKDGNGFIAKVSRDGKMITQKWIEGLNAPKGIVMQGTKMWVSDIDQLVEIDTNTGKVTQKYDAKGAVFLNDTAVDAEGNVYVSDIAKSSIWKMSKGKMEIWYNTPDNLHINGLRVIRGDKLLVAGWGRGMHDDGSTDSVGNLFTVDLKTKEMKNLGDGRPVGNIDGLERDYHGGFLVTEWVKGGLIDVKKDGSFKVLMPMKPGSADLDVMDNGHQAIVPHMLEDTITAYHVDNADLK